MVEVNSGDHRKGRVIQCLGAEYTSVGAHIGPDPISSRVKGVGINGFLPCLQRDVGSSKPLVCKCDLDIDLILVVIREVTVFLESEELAVGDHRSL